MALLSTLSPTLLSTTTAIDAKTATSTVIYTVPAGRTLFISHVLIRNPSATLAGGTSYSVTNFRQTFDLSTMTATTDYMLVRGADVTKYTQTVAGATISFTVTTGSTGAATVVVDLYGVLV